MRAFTILELLVSIFIIALMTAITVPGWRQGETTLALDRASRKLSQDIRKATELAQRAQFSSCATGTIRGYGMYISTGTPTSYTLYVECSVPINDIYNAGVDSVFQTIVLENRIQIDSATTPDSFSVLFVPPVPTITIQPADPENPDQAQITLSVVGDASRSKTITITTKGIIDID